MCSKRVVVTGYGAVCALGETVPEIWKSIMNYQVGYKRVELSDNSITAKFLGFVDAKKNRYEGCPKVTVHHPVLHASF